MFVIQHSLVTIYTKATNVYILTKKNIHSGAWQYTSVRNREYLLLYYYLYEKEFFFSGYLN